MSSVVIAGNTSGSITISAPDVSGSNTLTLPVATDTLVGKATTDTLTNKTLVDPTITGSLNTPNTFGFKNRIINGGMVIDQRNAGASVTAANGAYQLDRWQTYSNQASKFSVQQNAGAVTPPTGFSKYLGVTSLSAYSVLVGDYFALIQNIEGFNFADLGWGTASASTITISFWVRSSLTGTFGGSLQNSAVDRSYPFTYTISNANTWEQKTITIAGDTTGTWIGATNGIGVRVQFGLGIGTNYSGTAGAWSGTSYLSATGATSVVGTNGATFYITGVQLEKGSTATSFDFRDYGRELMMCQRYYYQITYTNYRPLVIDSATSGFITMDFPAQQRTAPTGISTTGTFVYRTAGGVQSGASTVTFNAASISSAFLNASGSSMTAGQIGLLLGTSATIGFTGAEL